MKKFLFLLSFLLFTSTNISAQSLLDLYPQYLGFGITNKLYVQDIERINGKEDQILSYDQEKFELYKDSIARPEAIRNIEIEFTEELDLQKAIDDLAYFPNLFYLKFSNFKFLRGEIQKDFPRDLSGIKNVEFINLYGSFEWDQEQLFKELGNLPRLRFLALNALAKDELVGADLEPLSGLEGLALSGREGTNLPTSIVDLSGLQSLILSADLYPDFAEQFQKLEELPQLKELYLSSFEMQENAYQVLEGFTRLERLELRSLKVKDLDRFFNSLSGNDNLSYLSVFNSGSENFTSGLSSFRKLRYLKLERLGEEIEIPEEVYSLNKLETLIISDNETFRTVDPAIGNLVELKELNLYYNKIESVPDEIGALTKLKELRLNNNRISQLPEAIGNFYDLEILDLNTNRIKHLPDHIGKLTDLRHLNLKSNSVQLLPDSFSNLKGLEELILEGNDLRELPESFGNLESLTTLHLMQNLLERLPESFERLISLESLYLQNNNLQGLPQNFGKLGSLQILFLQNHPSGANLKYYNASKGEFVEDTNRVSRKMNHIEQLPKSFPQLKNLRNVNLSHNPVETTALFEILKDLESKNYTISLENSGISELPVEGWRNIYASAIHLSNNKIASIPADIINAPFLKLLNLNGNPLKLSAYYDSREKLMIALNEAGHLKQEKLPQTPAMAEAYLDMGYGRSNKKEALRFFKRAFDVDSAFTATQIRKDDYAEALLEGGQYEEAIFYFTRAIQQDTAQGVRILNFIVPQFENRARAYLATGDTLSAIQDLETISRRFSASAWGRAGLLAKKIKRDSLAKYMFEKGVEDYQETIDWNEEQQRVNYGYQLSLLELYTISGNLSEAESYYEELQKEEISDPEDKVLLGYLGLVLEIIQEEVAYGEMDTFRRRLEESDVAISGWSFELIKNWLQQAELEKETRESVLSLTYFLENEL